MVPPIGRKRILIVEDDESISLGLRMNLEAEGYDVQVAADGEDGLTRAAAAIDQPMSTKTKTDNTLSARQVHVSHAGLCSRAVTAVAKCNALSRLRLSAKVVPERQGRAAPAQPKITACPRHVTARLTRGKGGDGALIRRRILPPACARVPAENGRWRI